MKKYFGKMVSRRSYLTMQGGAVSINIPIQLEKRFIGKRIG